MRYAYLLVEHYHRSATALLASLREYSVPPTVTVVGQASAGSFQRGGRSWVVLKLRAQDRDVVQQCFLNDYDQPYGEWFSTQKAALAELDGVSTLAFIGAA